MKFLGLSFLDGVSILEILVISVSGISVRIRQGFHGDDSPRATEVVFVFDGNAGLFHDPSNGSATRFVPFVVPTTRTRSTDEGGLHGEGIVGGEFFTGVQFGCESLEISVQPFTTFFEFTYRKGSRLKGVSKGIGLHGEMDSRMRSQGPVTCNLLFDGPLKGMSEFSP